LELVQELNPGFFGEKQLTKNKTPNPAPQSKAGFLQM
jgi:hypothetical protein